MSAPFARTPIGNLLAWIVPHDTRVYMGAFVGEYAARSVCRNFAGRLPAVQLCASADEARIWIEDQAAGLGLPVKWVEGIPQG